MKLEITIDLFSGRENPKIELEGNDARMFLESIQTGEALKENEIMQPSNLGTVRRP